MQKILLEAGALKKLNSLVADSKPKHIFLVTGKNSFQQDYIQKQIQPIQDKHDCVHLCEFSSDPLLEDIEQGVKLFRSHPIDLTITIGGGRVIDTAKLINFFAAQNISTKDYFLKKPENFETIHSTDLWG